MTETEWNILRDLRDGKLKWGAAVGATWGNLVAHDYVQPNFGGITAKGKAALEEQTDE